MLAPTAALALLAAVPLGLPPPPLPEEGWAAMLDWLRTVNGALTLRDGEVRLMAGGIAMPVLLLLEVAGLRKDWKLYPFLVPFWLVFGGLAFGAVAGVALTAAHLVLFPVGRIWFILTAPERGDGKAAAPPPATASAAGAPLAARPAPGSAAPSPARTAPDPIRAALEALRGAVEQGRAARPPAGASRQARAQARSAVLRALGTALGEAMGARGAPRQAARPPPLPPAVERDEATGAPPGSPDLSRFRPDLSRFRRRPPRG